MKNKKSKRRISIECVDDMIDALADLESAANERLAGLGAPSVKVEAGCGTVAVRVGDTVAYSASVSDANASETYARARKVIERAQKDYAPKARDEAPEPPRNFEGMTLEEMKERLDDVAEYANVRLVEIRGEQIADVAICAIFDGARCIVKSGDREVANVLADEDVFGAFKRCKAAIWKSVDDAKPWRKEEPEKRVERVASFEERLGDVVRSASEKLVALGEPALAASSDAAGFYVKSGEIPICSVPRGVGSAKEALEKASSRLLSFVDSARGAVERRRRADARASEIETDSGWDIAMIARNCPDVDTSEPWKLGPNPEAASTIVEATKKAVRAFNASIRHKFDEVSGLLGLDTMKMSVRGFTRGLVVAFGAETCFVTSFPLVANNSTTEETSAYVGATIASIGESRVKYYASIEEEISRHGKIRAIAEKKAALERELAEMAM